MAVHVEEKAKWPEKLTWRGFVRGYRAALRRASAELRTMAKAFDDEIEALQAEFQEIVAELRRDRVERDAELRRLQDEFSAVAGELYHDRVIREAIVERANSDLRLH